MNSKTVITYGTFDLLHRGHVNLLERLSQFGNRLIVAVSTDEFNLKKGKKSLMSYADRAHVVGALRCVDQVIAEESWEQKHTDVGLYGVDVFGIGDDWLGKFDDLKTQCEVVYLPRTENVSSTAIRQALEMLDETHLAQLKSAMDLIGNVVRGLK